MSKKIEPNKSSQDIPLDLPKSTTLVSGPYSGPKLNIRKSSEGLIQKEKNYIGNGRKND